MIMIFATNKVSEDIEIIGNVISWHTRYL